MLRLIFRNLWQKKTRTLFTIAGLAIATGTLNSLLAFQRGYARGLQQELSQLGAHILVVPKGCPYDAASLALHGASWPCYLKESYLAQVAQTPGVAVAAPVFMAAHYGAQREILAGINSNYLALRPFWRLRGEFPKKGEVLLGAETARKLRASAGSEISLEILKRKVRVSAVLEPVSGPDDDFIFMPLAEAQAALRQPGQLTHVLVKLASPDLLETVVQALRGCDAGMQMNIVPLAHLFQSIRSVSASARYLLAALSSAAFLIAGTALANTMFMAVLERTREIGVLRAVGASASQIFVLFAGEAWVVSLTGAVVGIGGSQAAAQWIEQWVRSQVAYAPQFPLVTLDGATLSTSVLAALTLGLIAGIAPAWRAAGLHPTAAFRAQAAY